MQPNHVLVVQEVCLAEPGVVKGQDEVVSCELVNIVEVVADHERVGLIVLREFLPNWSKIPGMIIEPICRASHFHSVFRFFVVHDEKKPAQE